MSDGTNCAQHIAGPPKNARPPVTAGPHRCVACRALMPRGLVRECPVTERGGFVWTLRRAGHDPVTWCRCNTRRLPPSG